MLRHTFIPVIALCSIAILASCSPSPESQMPEKPATEKQRLKQLSIAAPQAKEFLLALSIIQRPLAIISIG